MSVASQQRAEGLGLETRARVGQREGFISFDVENLRGVGGKESVLHIYLKGYRKYDIFERLHISKVQQLGAPQSLFFAILTSLAQPWGLKLSSLSLTAFYLTPSLTTV